MIKSLIVFASLSAAFAFIIYLFREMTGKQRWEIIKVVGYSAICAFASLLFLAAIVVAF
jgi:hypothetical protein